MRERYTNEVSNIAMASTPESDLDTLLAAEVTGPWWELLDELNLTLAVSREYEHFIVLLGAHNGKPVVSALEVPHPSGLFYDTENGELIISSTRTPNQIFWLRPLSADNYQSDVVPADFEPLTGNLFMPYKSLLLPGTLYIHDLVLINRELYATITGHNFLARINANGGWQRVWWPKLLDDMERAAFDQNYLQLNSIGIGDSPDTSFYTAFSDETFGPKPWKADYGPKGRGVVFDGSSREVMLRGLTCPHSAKLYKQELWLCDSGYGAIGKVTHNANEPQFEPVTSLPGFTRGLAFSGKYAFVGLSKVIDFYEPYAPGIKPSDSLCAVAAVNIETGETVATLNWPAGYQIYDVQTMPGVHNAHLPRKPADDEDINKMLRYLG